MAFAQTVRVGTTAFGVPLRGSLRARATSVMLARQVEAQALAILRPAGIVALAHRIRRNDEELPLPRVKASRYRPIPRVKPKRGQA